MQQKIIHVVEAVFVTAASGALAAIAADASGKTDALSAGIVVAAGIAAPVLHQLAKKWRVG